MSKSSAKEIAQHTSLTSPFRYYPSALPDLNLFFPPHWHNEFELNYIRSGRADITQKLCPRPFGKF